MKAVMQCHQMFVPLTLYEALNRKDRGAAYDEQIQR